MKITFRWYGKDDPVTLTNIRQIPVVSGVVSAVYDTPVGGVWSEESIRSLRDNCHANALECQVIESVPVHEDIKLGLPTAAKYIDNYIENIRRLAKYGVKVVCYNFMPVFDWLRSELKQPQADGSNTLAYHHDTVLKMDPLRSELSLPGWDSSYTKEGMKELLGNYANVTQEKLWQNLNTFLQAVVPAARQVGIKMAIHPDDPPWGIFGLPRIVTNGKNIARLLKLVDIEENGLTLCTGSLGVTKSNDLCQIIRQSKGRVHFVHMRNVKNSNEKDFIETSHPSKCGDVDMYAVMKALYDTSFDGYIRPDHGRMIWGEDGRPGYGLFDRALGAMYLYGLYEAISKG